MPQKKPKYPQASFGEHFRMACCIEYLQQNFEATLEMFLAKCQVVHQVEQVVITSIYNKGLASRSSYPFPKQHCEYGALWLTVVAHSVPSPLLSFVPKFQN